MDNGKENFVSYLTHLFLLRSNQVVLALVMVFSLACSNWCFCEGIITRETSSPVLLPPLGCQCVFEWRINYMLSKHQCQK